MNERAVRLSFVPSLAALMGLLAFSAYFAIAFGYTYGPEIRMETYTSIAKGLAGVLGAAILTALIISLTLNMRQNGLEQGLMRWLERNGEWAGKNWDETTEAMIRQKVVSVDPSEADQVERVLEERSRTSRLRRYASRLLTIPVVALAIVVGISLWSVLASGSFLNNFPFLNTAFIFAVSYGSVLALAILVVSVVLVLKE